MAARQFPRPARKPARTRPVEAAQPGPSNRRRLARRLIEETAWPPQAPKGGRAEAQGKQDRRAQAPGRRQRLSNYGAGEADQNGNQDAHRCEDRQRRPAGHVAALSGRKRQRLEEGRESPFKAEPGDRVACECPEHGQGERQAKSPQQLVIPEFRPRGMEGEHDIGDRIGQQRAAAEPDPGEIAAPHRPQAGDELAPEQYQDKPVVPHWFVIMVPTREKVTAIVPRVGRRLTRPRPALR